MWEQTKHTEIFKGTYHDTYWGIVKTYTGIDTYHYKWYVGFHGNTNGKGCMFDDCKAQIKKAIDTMV